jgi:hypothetical protein
MAREFYCGRRRPRFYAQVVPSWAFDRRFACAVEDCLQTVYSGRRPQSRRNCLRGWTEPMFTKELKQAGHSRRFTIQEAPGEGWEVREEADSRLVKVVQLRDWHRVERARMRIDAEVSKLEDGGWA